MPLLSTARAVTCKVVFSGTVMPSRPPLRLVCGSAATLAAAATVTGLVVCRVLPPVSVATTRKVKLPAAVGVQATWPRAWDVPPRSVELPEASTAKNSTLASVPDKASASAWSMTGWLCASVTPAGGLSSVTDWRSAAEAVLRIVTASWTGAPSVASPAGAERLSRKAVLPEVSPRLRTGTLIVLAEVSPSAHESAPLVA